MKWKPLVHTAVAGALLGVCIYTAADVAGDFTTFLILRRQAVHLANENDGLRKQIGFPYSLGPWYNARIGFSAGRNIAQCSFQLQGDQQITDVSVRGVRRSGVGNTFVYNVAGPGEWKLIDCSAMFPSGGGLVEPRSLMPAPGKPVTMQGASSSACDTCKAEPVETTAEQQEQQQPKTSRAWWRIWRRND